MKKSLLFRVIHPVLLIVKYSSFISSIVIVLCSYAWAGDSFGQKILDKIITIQLEKASFPEALDKISAKGVNFVYAGNMPFNNSRITLYAHKEKLGSVLEKLLAPYNLTYIVVDKNIVLKLKPPGQSTYQETQKEKVIRGTILDEKDIAVVGATIQVKGTQKGASTNVSGEFTISANEGDVLVIKYIGYITQEITVTEDTNNLQIVLIADETQLSEVVVTALGIKREKIKLGYAVQEVKGQEIEKAREGNIASLLTGKVAGLTIYNKSTMFENPTINLRGGSALIVIDGVPVRSDLWNINPDDVDNINVLKGTAATALYGSLGINGAIIITTKKGKSGANGMEVTF